MQYSIEPKTRIYVRGYGFYHLRENIKNNYTIKDQMLRKKIVHNASEYLGNKISDAAAKSKNVNIEKQEPVEEIIIQSEKRRNIKQVL